MLFGSRHISRMFINTTSIFKQYHLRPIAVTARLKWTKPISLAHLKMKTPAKVEQYKDANEPQAHMKLRDMPGPSMIENLTTIARDGFRKHHVFMEEMFERFGPIFRQSLPGEYIVYISDPIDVEHVFRSQENNNPYRGDNLPALYAKKHGLEMGTTGDDESWSVHRKLLASKLLQLGALKPYFDQMLNVADETVANFNEGRNVNLQDHLTRWAAESFGVVLFGLRVGMNYKSMNERAKALINAVNDIFSGEAKLILGIPLYKYFETPTLSRAYRDFETQLAITREIAAETRKQDTEVARNSLLMKLELDDKISEENTIFICNSLLLGAIHTTASSALHLIHTLSKHPDVQQKAYEEIRQVLGDSQQAPTYQQLSEMKYLRAMIREGFRYNAAPPANLRITKSPVTVRGYHIPPGTKVILSTIASEEMQRQKYGDPETFSPQRWLRSTEKEMHPFSSLPFSFGKRVCIGKRVVHMELSLLVLHVLQKYEIVESKDPVNWIFHLMITPDGPYDFYLKKRY